MYQENDIATQLQAEVAADYDIGVGGGSLASQLTAEGPPVIVQTMSAEGAISTPGTVAAAAAASPAPAAAVVVTPAQAPIGVLGRTWNGALNAVGTTSNSLNASGQKAAKSLGVSDETAAKIGPLVPWLLLGVVLTICGTVYALRHRIFSHKVTA
ncbi:MAG: hypothetical protein ACRYFX_12700 [Janthinobacterium lividum]